MRRRKSVFILVFGLFLSIGDQGRSQVTSPDEEGRKLFLVHCASCHGEDGRGKGAVAEAMKVPPADLTHINKRRDGKFPYDEVRNIISGLKLESVHGSRAMPVWGRVFTQMEVTEHGRLNLLLMYLNSIQEK
jgi:mono/diheme cytochrome c family protein